MSGASKTMLALATLAAMVASAFGSGPLRVLKSNPRYFTDDSGKAIYLTGSHTWDNFLQITRPAAYPIPAAMTPQNALSSTGYCLANPGQEYLVYQPAAGAFTLTLEAGEYYYEWFSPVYHTVISTGSFTAAGGSRSFTSPLGGEVVLYLHSTGWR